MSGSPALAVIEPVTEGAMDFSRPFMPDELSPLYHTPGYARLTPPQRLRYNQLHALYFNEQTMFFEKALARNVLGYFLAQPLPAEFKMSLRQFLLEESRHTGMFRALNRKCAPHIYALTDFYFIRVAPAAAAVLDFISKRPQWFPLLLWLMHLQEERALFFGRVFLKNADSLEPHFVAVQRRHVADETHHVRWDEALLDRVWPKTGLVRRHFNTRMLRWMIEEYFSTPKRAAVRVLAQWIKEFPQLAPRQQEFQRQLLDLGRDVTFRKSLYCRENVPDTFRRFDAWPEFGPLQEAMPGYLPGTNA